MAEAEAKLDERLKFNDQPILMGAARSAKTKPQNTQNASEFPKFEAEKAKDEINARPRALRPRAG